MHLCVGAAGARGGGGGARGGGACAVGRGDGGLGHAAGGELAPQLPTLQMYSRSCPDSANRKRPVRTLCGCTRPFQSRHSTIAKGWILFLTRLRSLWTGFDRDLFQDSGTWEEHCFSPSFSVRAGNTLWLREAFERYLTADGLWFRPCATVLRGCTFVRNV